MKLGVHRVEERTQEPQERQQRKQEHARLSSESHKFHCSSQKHRIIFCYGDMKSSTAEKRKSPPTSTNSQGLQWIYLEEDCTEEKTCQRQRIQHDLKKG